MARVEWHQKARLDVERLTDFLWERQADTAMRALSVIVDGAELLASSPRLGRPLGDALGRRALSLPFGSGAYVLYYVLETEDMVVILRVWHNR